MEKSGMETLYPELNDLFQLKQTRFDDDFKTVRFYGHTKSYQYLSAEGANHWKNFGVKTEIFSNLFPTEIFIKDSDKHFLGKHEKFASVEHYFQMYKYSDSDRNFMVELSSGDVASYGQRRLKFQEKHMKILRQLSSEKKRIP